MVRNPFGPLEVSIPRYDNSVVPTSYNCYVALNDKFILMLQLCQVFPNLVMYMVYTMVFSVYFKDPCLGLLQWIYLWFLLLFSFTTCTCGFMVSLHLFVLSGFD